MSWLKAFAAICFAGLVAGCGFAPIAMPVDGAGADRQLVVRDIKIEAADQRFAYELRRELSGFVTVDPAARYTLNITAEIKRTGLAITETDEITRFNLEALSKYRMVGIADDPVYDGDTRAVASVNATTDTFATQASERTAIRKVAKATGEKLITALRVIALRRSESN